MSTTFYRNGLPLLAITMAAAVLLAGVTAARAQGPMPGGSRDSRPASSGSDPVMQSTPRWDANHDGTFTCDEWKQYAARLFKLADLNSDGFLDAAEVKTLGRMEPLFAAADVGYFDGNRDNRISRPEFVDKPNPLFLRFDVNGDCKVTADEIKTTSSPGRQERGRSPGGGRGGPGGGGGPGGFGGNSLGGFGGGSPGGL